MMWKKLMFVALIWTPVKGQQCLVCPDPYFFYEGACFWLPDTNGATYIEAFERCDNKATGSELIRIKTSTFLPENLNRVIRINAYIDESGTWKKFISYDEGKPLTEFDFSGYQILPGLTPKPWDTLVVYLNPQYRRYVIPLQYSLSTISGFNLDPICQAPVMTVMTTTTPPTTTTLMSTTTTSATTTPKCASIPSFMTENKIVGGQVAPKPIPWQVGIVNVTGGRFAPFCGGTILDENTILSAAHCFDGINIALKGISVIPGITSLFGLSSSVFVEVANGVWNSQMPYDNTTKDNDFVILKLAKDLSFDENIKPACLPSDSSYAPEKNQPTCYTSGWGVLEYGGQLSDTLRWVGVPLMTNTECSNLMSNSRITGSMICAGFPEGGKDSCQGDSGGPLVCNEDGKAVLTGVVSFGNGCAWPNNPGVYARVTAVLKWIKENMGGNRFNQSPFWK